MNSDEPNRAFLRSYFAGVLAEKGARGPVGALLSIMANNDLTDEAFETVVDTHGVRRETGFRDQLLDLILGYIRAALLNGPSLTEGHQANVRYLRRHLQIRDGEFMDRRPAEVAEILNAQFERILEDGIIDGEEELYQVELQAAFGIGYDDYLTLSRRAFENAYRELANMSERSPEAAAKMRALEPLYRLVLARPRSLGALY